MIRRTSIFKVTYMRTEQETSYCLLAPDTILFHIVGMFSGEYRCKKNLCFVYTHSLCVVLRVIAVFAALIGIYGELIICFAQIVLCFTVSKTSLTFAEITSCSIQQKVNM